MSQPEIKWGKLKTYLQDKGYEISGKGGETKISAPPSSSSGPRSRNQVVIGHKCSNHAGSKVYDCYLNAIRNAFGITRKDILDG